MFARTYFRHIDKNALFYLKARGIEEKEAIKMIIKRIFRKCFQNIKSKVKDFWLTFK